MWDRIQAIRSAGIVAGVMLLAGLLSACSPPSQPPTNTPTPSATITPAPPTETPTPTLTATPGLIPPCPITATRMPPPAAPTYGPDSGDQPTRVVDPYVTVCADRATLAVGETLTLEVQSFDIGLPYFRMSVAAGTERPVEIGVTTYMGPMTPGAPFTGLELLAATGTMSQAEFTLRALQPGTYSLTVLVNGEIHYGYPGPASWSAITSPTVLIQVEN